MTKNILQISNYLNWGPEGDHQAEYAALPSGLRAFAFAAWRAPTPTTVAQPSQKVWAQTSPARGGLFLDTVCDHDLPLLLAQPVGPPALLCSPQDSTPSAVLCVFLV